MDMHTLVEIFSPDAHGIRLRQGAIVSVQADTTATITIAGCTTTVSGVKVASSCCPIPGSTCWIATDGRDLFVLATLAPAGPAWGNIRKSATQSMDTGTWEAVTWVNRTEETAVGMTADSGGLTCVVPGLYAVTFVGALDAAGDTTWPAWSVFSRLTVNGTSVAENGGPAPGTASFVARASVTTRVSLAPGDVLNAAIYQNSGAGLSTAIGAGQNVLTAAWLGPAG